MENDSNKNNKLKSGLRYARILLLLIMAVAALILIFSNRDKINMDNLKRLAAKIDLGLSTEKQIDKTIIDFDYDSTGVVDVYKDGIVRVTTDNLVVMDSVGTQFQSVLTGFSAPALITTNKYILAYDQGGKRLIVTNSFTVLFDKTFEDNIVSVSMNENGYIAVITESNAYKNKLIIFDSSFREVYKINSLNRYIISADVSNDNRYVAVSSLYIKDSNTIPQIVYYKLNSEEVVWEYSFEDNIAVTLKTKNTGSVCSLFEWGTCILDSNGDLKYKYEFGNRILQNCHLDNDKYNIMVLSESLNGNSEIVIFNNKGKQVSDINVDYSVLSVDVYDDRFVVLSRDGIYVYSMSGKLLDERKNTNDASKALFTDKNSIMLVSTSNVVYNVIN